MKGTTFLLTTAACVVLAGCVSFATPERPAYTGVDQVEAVDSKQLVGIWRVTELNPMPEGGSQITVIEYKSDGTVTGQIEPSKETASLGIGQLSMNGQWSVSNGLVSHTEITAQSDSESQFGGLVASMINRSARNMGGEANIFEISPNRIVMVGTDGAAMQYDRR